MSKVSAKEQPRPRDKPPWGELLYWKEYKYSLGWGMAHQRHMGRPRRRLQVSDGEWVIPPPHTSRLIKDFQMEINNVSPLASLVVSQQMWSMDGRNLVGAPWIPITSSGHFYWLGLHKLFGTDWMGPANIPTSTFRGLYLFSTEKGSWVFFTPGE